MFIIEPYQARILEEYREIEEIQSRINKIAREAEDRFATLSDEDKEYEIDYLKCIRSYVAK